MFAPRDWKHSRPTRPRVLLAAAVLAVAVCAVWFTGGGERRPAKGNVLRNPPGMTDRLVMIDSADDWRRGSFLGATCREAVGGAADVRLTESPAAEYPRTGTWTSPETATEFPFTEFIPSWNVSTPPGTGIRVDVRVRQRPLLGRARWSPWLYIGSWGRLPPGERRTVSFENGVVNVDNLVLDRPADAYQVRVRLVSFDTDPLATPALRRLAVSYSGIVSGAGPDARRSMAADRAGAAPVAEPTSPSIGAAWARSLPVPFRTQKDAPPALRGQICSPTSVSMVLAYWGVDRPTVENAQAIYDPDHDMFGNWNRAVARAGELGLDAWLTRFRTWDAVKAEIARGQPVIAAIQFKKGEMPSAVFGSTNGHLIVIRGFTPGGDVIVNDPASKEHGEGAVYKADQLARAWFEHGGVGYIIRGVRPRPTSGRATAPGIVAQAAPNLTRAFQPVPAMRD
jgi:hypothetical protein